MKKLFLILALLTSLHAVAEPTVSRLPIVCEKHQEVLINLSSPPISEKIIWMGETEDKSVVMLMANPTTNTWSVVLSNNKIACLVLEGRNNVLHTHK